MNLPPLRRKITRICYKSQEHRYLAFDMHFSINVPRVGLNRPGLYAQSLGDPAVSQPLTDQFGYFALARRQIVSVLYERPLLCIKQYDLRLLGRRIATFDILDV